MFNRNVSSKILDHIKVGELTDKRTLLGYDSQMGRRRVKQYEHLAMNLSEKVVG